MKTQESLHDNAYDVKSNGINIFVQHDKKVHKATDVFQKYSLTKYTDY